MGKRCAEISCPERKTDDIAGIAENDIGKVIEDKFFLSFENPFQSP